MGRGAAGGGADHTLACGALVIAVGAFILGCSIGVGLGATLMYLVMDDVKVAMIDDDAWVAGRNYERQLIGKRKLAMPSELQEIGL
jgi:hypothetical protein